MRRLAPVSDDAGYDSIWVSDRTVFPVDLADRYPGMFGPGHANPEAQNVLEALTTLSYVAGSTKKVRFGVSILVLPFRNTILNAKMITTLDVLSGGRATLHLDDAQFDESGIRVILTGRTQEVIDNLKRHEEAGLEYMALSVAARDADSTIDAIKRFAEDVQPRFQ